MPDCSNHPRLAVLRRVLEERSVVVALILVGVVGLSVVFLLGGASSFMGGRMDEMFIERMIPPRRRYRDG